MDLFAAYMMARAEGNLNDSRNQHEFTYQSNIKCPIVELRDAHKRHMECIKSVKSYQVYNQAARDKLNKAEEVINKHPKCDEYWTWYNANAYFILKEMSPDNL